MKRHQNIFFVSWYKFWYVLSIFGCFSTVSSVPEVIIDYGSAFVTYGNEIESKEVQFPDRGGPDKICGGGYSAVAHDTSLCTTGAPTLGCVLMKGIDYSSLVTCSSGVFAF